MLSREELLKMREMTFEDIDPKEIQDVEKLKIDVKKSKPEKVREILESGKNPYFLKTVFVTSLYSLLCLLFLWLLFSFQGYKETGVSP